jgi:hypothetical protein
METVHVILVASGPSPHVVTVTRRNLKGPAGPGAGVPQNTGENTATLATVQCNYRYRAGVGRPGVGLGEHTGPEMRAEVRSNGGDAVVRFDTPDRSGVGSVPQSSGDLLRSG